MNVIDFLEGYYNNAVMQLGSQNTFTVELPTDIREDLDEILKNSEGAKGVLTVVLTSIIYKSIHPEQDIRRHQTSIEGGYSGRTFDSHYITPFLKKHRFPSMAESGWLTRSLEQKIPYDEQYTGAIRPISLKSAFLRLLSTIEQGYSCESLLLYLLQGLIIKRNTDQIDLAKPVDLPIKDIIGLLNKHFFAKYHAEGASRLPVLALYAAYMCLMNENARFKNKILNDLESHTSSDIRSGRIGDIEISSENGKPFEAVEVKHSTNLSVSLLKDSFEKFSKTQVQRYYLLSTNETISPEEKGKIDNEIERIKKIHGCQVIVNGLVSTLKYYLRVVEDPAIFISNYVDLLENDKSLKFEHKQQWNYLIGSAL